MQTLTGNENLPTEMPLLVLEIIDRGKGPTFVFPYMGYGFFIN